MTQGEYHQQELERQERETTATIANEEGEEIDLHIWGDQDTVFMNIKNWPLSMTVYLSHDQAEKIVQMLNNARRVK